MIPTHRRYWLAAIILLAGVTVWSVLVGAPSLLAAGLTLAAIGMFAYQVWAPWQGPRHWVRLRYHSPEPPDAEALQRSLSPLLRYGAIVVRWHYTPDGIQLWLEISARLYAILPALLATAVPDLRLEPGTPSVDTATQPLFQWPLRHAGTGHPADPLNFAQTLLPRADLRREGELRLILLKPAAACLLVVGAPPTTVSRRVPVRWLLRHRALARLRAWVIEHYPWGEPWPNGAHDLPLMHWPATVDSRTLPLDTHHSYQIPLTPCLPGVASPYLDLGVSTANGEPAQVSLDHTPHYPPAVWRGHFLSIGRSDDRFAALRHLAQQALTWGAQIVAIDPTHTLVPHLSIPLASRIGQPPAWINRNHPRGSVRLNLLACPPDPAFPPAEAEAQALHLALTSALPLFDQFLARLGVAPWSLMHGDILVHDIALAALLQHHRTRLGEVRTNLAPTPYAIYHQLRAAVDVRSILAAELEAWTQRTAFPDRAFQQISDGPSIYKEARAALEAALTRWETQPLRLQEDARQRLVSLLQPVFDHPGLLPFWCEAVTAPSSYFNRNTSPITFTHLLPSNAGDRDRVLAQWYAEYLLLTIIAAGQARPYSPMAAPPLLVVLDNLPAWWDSTLLGPHLPDLGAVGIACAATGTHLPPPPDSHQILQAFGTWWIYALDPAAQAYVAPHLTTLKNAADIPLAYFPAETALLRTTTPRVSIGTISVNREPLDMRAAIETGSRARVSQVYTIPASGDREMVSL